MATPRILGLAQDNHPQILDKAEQDLDEFDQPESFLSKLPRNILAGLAQQGHSLLNLPKDIAQTFEKRGQEFSSGLKIPGEQIKTKDALSQYIPSQSDYDFAQMLGQKGEGTLFDKLIQKGVEFAPEIAGGFSLLRHLPLTQKLAARPLKRAQRLANEREINELEIDPNLLREARQFINMKNPDVRKLYEEAYEGGYEPLMSLQSDIGREARALRKSPIRAESRMAPHASGLKRRILEDIKRELREQGHEDIAELMGKGINKYRQYKNLDEKVYPVLKKLGIPIGLTSLLGFGIKKGKKLIND